MELSLFLIILCTYSTSAVSIIPELKYSCASALYFKLDKQMINCIFDYYFNKTGVKPSILDGGYETVLANWPGVKRIVCSMYNNIPIEIPSHSCELLNRTVLCNCIIEAQNNWSLLQHVMQTVPMWIWRCISWPIQHF